MEIWKSIDGYEGLYEVSNFGNVKTLPKTYVGNSRGYEQTFNYKAAILKPFISAGYYRLELTNRQGSKKHLIHKLVATAFCKCYRIGLVVNHKDGNKLNNHVSNLEWCTPKENTQHAAKVLGVMKGKRTKVIDTATGKIFDSIKSAHENFNFPFSVSHLANMIGGYRINKTTLIYQNEKQSNFNTNQ